jgi:short-subunit dehydrogenase
MFERLNQPIRTHDWPGLRVWLIGASTGIGASLALQLSGLGARLVLSARHQETLEAVAADCCRHHPASEITVLPFDACNASSVGSTVAEIDARWGGVDLVIYNAGTYEATRIDTLSADAAEKSLRVNLLAPMATTAAIMPLLMKTLQDGKPRGLAYVASVAGYRGLPRALTYGPGKAGLISFAESLWIDLHGMGLNTWVINPGFVRTRLTAQNSFEMPALIEPEDAARAILHGFSRGDFEIHFPKRFTLFMKWLRLLPTHWYLRLAQRLVPPLPRNHIPPLE